MQDDKVIAYASRELKKNKLNYPMQEMELATVLLYIKFGNHFNMEKESKCPLIK